MYGTFSQPTYKKEFAHPFGKYQQDILVAVLALISPKTMCLSSRWKFPHNMAPLAPVKDSDVIFDGIHMAQ